MSFASEASSFLLECSGMSDSPKPSVLADSPFAVQTRFELLDEPRLIVQAHIARWKSCSLSLE